MGVHSGGDPTRPPLGWWEPHRRPAPGALAWLLGGLGSAVGHGARGMCRWIRWVWRRARWPVAVMLYLALLPVAALAGSLVGTMWR